MDSVRVDYRATSRRPQWADLPVPVRAGVEALLGHRVAAAERSVTSGFTGGFAAVLQLDDGTRVFAKAGGGANPHLPRALAAEATVLAGLPAGVPAPRLLAAGAVPVAGPGGDDDEWRVLVVEALPGDIVDTWTPAALEAVHRACLAMAAALTPPPDLPHLSTIVQDWGQDPAVTAVFTRLACGDLPLTHGQPHWLPGRYGDLQGLVDLAPRALAGGTALHNDLRGDNVLLDDGTAVVVDWNWLTVGPPWLDLVGVLPVARADGVDVDGLLATSPLTRDVDPDDVDCWLAMVAAFMLGQADQPLFPGGQPPLRDHQRRYAATFLEHLAARRGWG